MGLTRGRVAAHKVLEAAKKHATKDVIVVSKGKDGSFYLASSMSSACSQHLAEQVNMLKEAHKMLRRLHAKAANRETKMKAKTKRRCMSEGGMAAPVPTRAPTKSAPKAPAPAAPIPLPRGVRRPLSKNRN